VVRLAASEPAVPVVVQALRVRGEAMSGLEHCETFGLTIIPEGDTIGRARTGWTEGTNELVDNIQ
jgi:hypothetical protein